MNKERLALLADVLERVPEEKLHFGSWQNPQFYNPQFGDRSYNAHVFECGTTACAAGWAMSIPAFARAGLKPSGLGCPTYNNTTHFNALSDFFDLTRSQTQNIFGMHIQNTPKEHAAYIRKLIEDDDKYDATYNAQASPELPAPSNS